MRRADATRIETAGDAPAFSAPFPGVDGDVTSPEYWEALERAIPKNMRSGFEPLARQAKALVEYETRQDAIDAACDELERYREEYTRLADDFDACQAQSAALFSEPAFSSFRLTADDLQRAFEAVGYLPPDWQADALPDAIKKVIDHLVDPPRRKEIVSRLFCLLPDYVKQGRIMEAWIVRHNAFVLMDTPEKSCGSFLVQMFLHGMRDWQARRDRERDELFERLGIDPEAIRNRDFADVLDQLTLDPAKEAEIAHFLQKHPEFGAMSDAAHRRNESLAQHLLQREDAIPLLLSFEEIRPWLDTLGERLDKTGGLKKAVLDNAMPRKKDRERLVNILYEMGCEMAEALFDGSRLQQLAEAVRRFRRGLDPSDHEGQVGADFLLVAVTSACPPGESHLLAILCATSIMRANLIESLAAHA